MIGPQIDDDGHFLPPYGDWNSDEDARYDRIYGDASPLAASIFGFTSEDES